MARERILHHVGGEPSEPKGGEFFDDVGPATGTVVARVARGGAEDVEVAVRAGMAALDGEWGRTPVSERAALLDRIADAIEAQAEDLAELESLDTGKPLRLAREVDIARAIANFRFFAGALRHHQDPTSLMDGAINYTLRRPVGVVGLITPWNLPLYLLSWKAAPALAMGNAVIAKPSELTPLSAQKLAEITAGAGLPAGAFNVVQGLGPEAGAALVAHPQVKAISFTGGTRTGRQVALDAAPHFKKLSLELGGKNPTLVFADCDPDAAIEGALRAAFTNQGQICLCGSRILVERSLYDEFVARFADRTSRLTVGNPRQAGSRVGALISRAHLEKVESYLELARSEGGRIVTGGHRPELTAPFDAGYFLEPTVIVDLPPTCRTATEEIFGPVVSVHPFESEDEAVTIANGTRYGLSASVWTRDLGRAHRLAARLDCGTVWVNTWMLRDLRVPFGGTKDSGVGREGGAWSLDFFSEARNVCIALETQDGDDDGPR